MTVPLALRLPKICDGFAPPIKLKTTEPEEGCKNDVVSPAAILKLLQFKTASWLTVTSSCEPSCRAVALPAATVMPAGLAATFNARPIRINNMEIQINFLFKDLFFIRLSKLPSHAEVSYRFSGAGGCGRFQGPCQSQARVKMLTGCKKKAQASAPFRKSKIFRRRPVNQGSLSIIHERRAAQFSRDNSSSGRKKTHVDRRRTQVKQHTPAGVAINCAFLVAAHSSRAAQPKLL